MNNNKTDSVYDLRFNLNYYGADYTVDSLVKRMIEKDFIIPNFQRQFVWKIDEASKFIESLLLGLPVPSIFLSKDKFSQHLIVIDGQQRLKTLEYFYRGEFEDMKPFKLTNVSPHYNGLTYKDLYSEDRRNLDNTTIHCTIIAENEDSNAIFYLFERLNTTGTPLNAQEIRNGLFHGEFTKFLFDLASTEKWKRLYNKEENRLEDQELILRFFALYFDIDQYSGNLTKFLNDFMLENRDFSKIPKADFYSIFNKTFDFIFDCLGNTAFYNKKQFNKVLFETLSLTIAKNPEIISSCEKATSFYEKLTSSNEFWKSSRSSTTGTKKLTERLKLAEQLLNNL